MVTSKLYMCIKYKHHLEHLYLTLFKFTQYLLHKFFQSHRQTSVTVEENEIYAEIGTARADKQDSVELNTESTQTKENTYEYMYTEDDYEEMTTLT